MWAFGAGAESFERKGKRRKSRRGDGVGGISRHVFVKPRVSTQGPMGKLLNFEASAYSLGLGS